jgi:hypothetical protein
VTYRWKVGGARKSREECYRTTHCTPIAIHHSWYSPVCVRPCRPGITSRQRTDCSSVVTGGPFLAEGKDSNRSEVRSSTGLPFSGWPHSPTVRDRMSIENTYWKNVLTVVPIVGAALATLTYILRLVSCRISTVGLRLEDLLMGIGLILSYCATAFVIYSRFRPFVSS